jgi:micrococcal nuclease
VKRVGLDGGRLGSAVLLVVAAVLLLRPWEGGRASDPGSGSPGPSYGTVVRAVDGDTLEVRLGGGELETVRLIGVDTPETVKPDTPVQCFGPAASSFEHRVVEGRRIRLLPGVEPRDVYGRLLAYVWLRPNVRRLSDKPGRSDQRERFVNAALVRRGLARTLTIPPNDRFAERFAALQRRAARAPIGLWAAC